MNFAETQITSEIPEVHCNILCRDLQAVGRFVNCHGFCLKASISRTSQKSNLFAVSENVGVFVLISAHLYPQCFRSVLQKKDASKKNDDGFFFPSFSRHIKSYIVCVNRNGNGKRYIKKNLLYRRDNM